MKIVSQLDPNGYFVAPVEADPCPLEDGVFLLPGGAVDALPPIVPMGQLAKWTGDEWAFEPAPEAEPSPPKTPDELRAEQLSDIDERREQALRGGVVWSGLRHHSDDRFLTELLGMLMGYQVGVYTGTQDIRTMDNTVVQLDAQQITALASAVGAHRKAVYAQSWAEKDAL